MIGITLNGGLGNMMFQIAALEDMGRRSGFMTCYPELDARLHLLMDSADHSQNAFEYLNIFRNFNWHKNYDKAMRFERRYSIPHRYVHIEPDDNSLYTGYFQSERYFERDATLKLFEPSDRIIKEVSQYDFTDSCSIHVRRGDYTERYKGIYAILDMAYYRAAMEKVKASRYYIFSDDLDWCRDNFKGDEFIFVVESPQVELFMMSQCTHNIIANSSFSWWGSYLNRNPWKIVNAPPSWYTTTRFSAMDIYCNNWTIL